RQCGLAPLLLADSRTASFFNGCPLSPDWFAPFAAGKNAGSFAVFIADGSFAGVLHTGQTRRIALRFCIC
ncbi:hypothetical protein, partial [Treponema endosymbiont of Eucomonympha sp.]|uniref:hypothetical protein n=1 Tax=Treponema endosymbiont of Eucomonympha sp. TaxID=1580831 RepID=UPI001650C2A1